MAIDRAHKNQEPDIEEVLDDLALRIGRLRVLYEQYFMGIEKMEPHTARKEVSRKIIELQQQNIRNTGLRYRFNTMVQKFSVYTTYWNRTLRAIEAGTYFRDVARVGRTAIQRGQDIPDEVLRAMPERLRAKVLKQREQLASRQGKLDAKYAAKDAAEAEAKADADNAAAELGAAENTEPSGRPPVPRVHDLEDDAEIDSAFDNLFGEASDAVANVVSRPVRPTSPPPMQAAPVPVPAPRTTTPPPVPMPRVSTPPPIPAGAAAAKTPAPAPRMSTPPPIPAGAAARTPPPIPVSLKTPAPELRTPAPTIKTPTIPDADRRTPTPILKTPTPTPFAGGLPPGVDESVARDLHRKYVQAKRLLGENTDNIKYEHIVATIAKQAPAIMKQHQAKSVEFQVVIKDDKVILKATPKK